MRAWGWEPGIRRANQGEPPRSSARAGESYGRNHPRQGVASLPEASRIVFRPPLALRLILGLFGTACGAAALLLLLAGRWLPAVILAIPVALGASALRARVVVDPESAQWTGLIRSRRIVWADIVRLDRTRRGILLVTRRGWLEGGWLSPSAREDLARLIVRRANLTPVLEELPFGITARYVPRARPLHFLPHNLRRERNPPGGSQVD